MDRRQVEEEAPSHQISMPYFWSRR
jgi:hypothetical protein